MNLIIRKEEVMDFKQTETVIKEAFLTAEMSDGNEHKLVERLRKSKHYRPKLSLVAELDGKIVGHVMLTTNTIAQIDLSHESLTLAPVSVLLPYRNQGIGKKLVKSVLDLAKEQGFKSAIVLGHPEYYPKLGFKPAILWEITPPFPVPSEAFMAIELVEDGLKGIKGMVQYPSEFFEV